MASAPSAASSRCATTASTTSAAYATPMPSAGVNSPYGNAFGIFSENSLASTFRGNTVTGTTASTQSNSWGIHVLGAVNTITDNHVIGSPLANDIGILGSGSTSCYDNHVRSP